MDVSSYLYAIPAAGCIAQADVNLCLTKEETSAIKMYFENLFKSGAPMENPNYSVWVSPYLLRPKTFAEDLPRIANMADSWFDNSQEVKIGEYESTSFPVCEGSDELYATTLFLPVVIREKHTAPVTIREIEESLGIFNDDVDPANTGRFLHCLYLFEDLKEYGVEEFADSKAYKVLDKKCQSIFQHSEETYVCPCLIPAADAPNFHNELFIGLRKDAKKKGVKIVCD